MLAQLDDPYTRLLRPDDYAALKDSTSGKPQRVGLQLAPAVKGRFKVVVISALEGSPAAEAGGHERHADPWRWMVNRLKWNLGWGGNRSCACVETWAPRWC